jgi:N-acetylmuramoyl-L-alanine amidase
MTNQINNKNRDPNPRSIIRGTLFNLEIVVLLAILLATVYAAWSPGSGISTTDQQAAGLDALPTSSGAISQQEQSLPEATLLPAGENAQPEEDVQLGIVVGHWGDENDPGSVCADQQLTELKVNQEIATLLEKALTEQGYKVTLLKEFDRQLAGFKALALVSIHADSCDYINDQASGYKVAAAMGQQNQAESTQLAACLRSRYAQATGLKLHSTSITPDMTSYHAFDEISPNTPAVIIETGFLNLDQQFLTEQPELAARGILDGILCFLNNEDITNNSVQPTP